MGRTLTTQELIKHKNQALSKIDNYLTKLATDPNTKIQSKADKLSYWIKDWTKFLEYEQNFNASSLRRYKRGEIVKVHLGYNIGSEEGGLHYCVVVEKDNSRNSPVLTVVPLTSIKKKTDLEHLRPGEIDLGNELFTNLNSKISFTQKKIESELEELAKSLDTLADDAPLEEFNKLHSKVNKLKKEADMFGRMKDEVSKMKMGSIALVKQIRTISKIRIYDPKTNFDILSNVKLSNEKLDLIDNEVIKNFTGRKNV
jgi:mRNA-degrading endonuclease toxin of MazEF toxin-antitoxin module